MASTYSSNIRLELMASGENDATWGTKTNTNLQLLEAAIAGRSAVTHDDTANYTLTTANGSADEARRMILNIGGALTAARNVVCPTQAKFYVVKNATTGGYAVTLKTSGGTGIAVPNGKTMMLFCDGTNVVEAIDTIGGVTFAGTTGTTMTFPTTSATIARTDAANTFTGVQSMTSPDITTSVTTPSATFTAFAGATTLLNWGGTGALASTALPSTLDSTSISTGSLRTAGGLGVTKALWVGGLANIAGAVTMQSTLAVTTSIQLAGATAWTSQTGTGAVVVMGTSPAITTSLTSPSTTFTLLASPTTVNFAQGASTALNIGHASGTNTISGATTFNQTVTSAGQLKSTADNQGFLIQPVTGTAGAYFRYLNTGGSLYIGLDDSTGANFGTAGNYGSIIYRPAATTFAISRTSTVDLSISAAGAVTIPGTLGVTGNVTVGAASGAKVVTVNAGAGVQALLDLQNNSVSKTRVQFDGTNSYFEGNGGVLYFLQNIAGTTIDVINVSAGVRLTQGATSWGAISDERMKVIVEPITDAVRKVSTLRHVIGRYKTDDVSLRRSMIIAQDVQKVLPEAVYEDTEGLLGARYADLIPLHGAAIAQIASALHRAGIPVD